LLIVNFVTSDSGEGTALIATLRLAICPVAGGGRVIRNSVILVRKVLQSGSFGIAQQQSGVISAQKLLSQRRK
jgi:hypothetical protein